MTGPATSFLLASLLLYGCSQTGPDFLRGDLSERAAREEYEKDRQECRVGEDYQACMKKRGWRG